MVSSSFSFDTFMQYKHVCILISIEEGYPLYYIHCSSLLYILESILCTCSCIVYILLSQLIAKALLWDATLIKLNLILSGFCDSIWWSQSIVYSVLGVVQVHQYSFGIIEGVGYVG